MDEVKEITKGYKYRIYPNEEQKLLLAKTFGCNRFVWNQCLAKSIKEYEEWKANHSTHKPRTDQSAFNDRLNQLKTEHDWLYEASSVSLQQTTRDICSAYSKFFKGKGKVGYPKFKKRTNRNSFRLVGNAFKIQEGMLYIVKDNNPVKIKWHRELPSIPSSCTISKDPDGKYYVSFVVKVAPKLTNGTKKTGIDLGLTHFAVTSDGIKYENPKHFNKSQKRLAKEQRRHSKKTKGSNNRNKSRIKVARLHSKISNQRSDFLHKLSRQLVNENQVLAMESLSVKNMMKNHKLAKGIADASWGTFTRLVEYKTHESGKCVLYTMHPFYPSSQLCSECGHRNQEVSNLKVRKWTCIHCNTTHDRDVNAAKNILFKAVKTEEEHNANGEWTPTTLGCSIVVPVYTPAV